MSNEDEEKVLSNEEIMSAFVTLAAEGFYGQAIDSYGRALQLRQNDKNVLVSRSRCLLLVGNAVSSLQDAEQALQLDPAFFKAVFQKAEALYAMGDFEAALVFYHRGNRLRPELEEFRIGIQKSREAIENSIGDPEVRISIQPALKKTVLQMFAAQNQFQQAPALNESSNLAQSFTKAIVPRAAKVRNTETPQTPNVVATVNPSSPTSVNAFLAYRGITPPAVSTLTPAMECDLYEDKAYLQKLLSDRDLLEHPNDSVLRLVADGLVYFNKRIEFWRQQNPLYARHAHHATQVRNGKTGKEKQEKLKTGRGAPVYLPPINDSRLARA